MLRNIGVLALYMLPCLVLSATTKMRHATAFTFIALFAALVLPLLHGIASVIAGATKPEQVRANAAAGAWEPSADVLAELRSL